MASSKSRPRPVSKAAGPAPARAPRKPDAARPARTGSSPAETVQGGALVALVDGVALPEAEASALWHAFSAHMDEHQGDLAGFAAARGYREVKPEFRKGQAVLVVTTR